MDTPINTLKKQLAQIKDLHESGALSQLQYDEAKTALERRVLDLVLTGQPEVAAVDASGRKKPSNYLIAILVFGVLAIAGLGYWWTGTPSQAGLVAPSSKDAGNADAPAGTPHATNFDQIAAMTERLAVRMKEQPNDAEGWAMLARSYSVLGNHPDALKAYEKAVALRKDDATLLADYADALAVKNNRILGADSMKQVDRALKIDPRNLKALSLAGTYAFDRKDYAAAAKYWGQVVQFGPADNGIVQQIAPALAEARSLAGLPDVSPAQDLGAKATAVSGGNLTGTVTLASALLQKAQPDDTVFVFARAAEGSRMPLAIVRKQVRDLPFNFILDDTTSMSPANKLSAAKKVIVGARVSKSGNAMPQPGDLSGQTGPVDVGASGLKLEIKELVKP